MKTVKEWIDFLNDDIFIFGVRLKTGTPCPRSHYYSKKMALEKYNAYLNEKVVEAFPMNFQEDGKTGALLII